MNPKTSAILAALVSAGAFAALATVLGIDSVRLAAPAFAAIPLAVYLKGRESASPFRIGPMLNEAPSVVSMMSAVLAAGGSLDAAIRYVAENGPARSSAIFGNLVTAVDCREAPDMREAFHRMLSSMPAELGPYRRAMHMVVSASDATGAEMSRILREATESALTGLRQAGEEYSSKLQSPCMVVFALGIMVPMILLSIVPLLGIGGEFGAELPVNDALMEFLVLVAVPVCVGMVMVSIRGRNPMSSGASSGKGWWRATIFLAAVPLCGALRNAGFDDSASIVIAVIAASMLALATVLPEVRREKARVRTESALKDVLFDLGNRLVAGENFESALTGSMAVRKECRDLAERLSREIALCRGDVAGAVQACVSPVSPQIAGMLADVHSASLRDIRDSGRLATALAHQLQDRDSVWKATANRLRSLSDMMTGTAAVFAPLVLGMSIMMLGPISGLTGGADIPGTFSMVAVYLCELAFMMSGFSAVLSDRFGSTEVVYRASIVLPVAMAILLVCSRLSF